MTKTTAITVSVKTLRMMLAGVLPHAATDDTLPMLQAVKIEVRSGVLYLIATDRYSIGTARQRIPGWLHATGGRDLDALMDAGDARKLSELLTGRDGAAALIFDTGPEPKLTVDLGTEAPVTWEITILDGLTWPDWRKLLAPLLSETPAAVDGKFGIDMRLLARFAALDPAQFAAYWEEDEPEPEWPAEAARIRVVRPTGPAVLVTRGNWFIGAAMGSHLRENTHHAPSSWDDWAATLAGNDTVAQQDSTAVPA